MNSAHDSTNPPPVDPLAERERIFAIAARSGADPRTVMRAMREGADVIHGVALRERVRRAMRETEGR